MKWKAVSSLSGRRSFYVGNSHLSGDGGLEQELCSLQWFDISLCLLHFQSSSSGECTLRVFQSIFQPWKKTAKKKFIFFLLYMTTLSSCLHICPLCAGGCSQASAGTKQQSCSCSQVTTMEPSWSESQRQTEVWELFPVFVINLFSTTTILF